MKKPLLIMTGSALATAALFFASAPARSAPVSTSADVVRIVPTADLNLSSTAGQKALDRRLTRAVIELCGQAADADLVGLNSVRKCRADTLVKAQKVRDQRLSQRSAEPIRLAARD